MSGCQCYNNCPEQPESLISVAVRRGSLFNWVTTLLVSMWVGIVATAMVLAGPENLAPVPTLELFIRSLL